MFCKNCGCEILNDSQFCENCGTKVERVPDAPAQAVQTTAAPQPAVAAPAPAPVAAPVAAPEYQAVPVTPVYPPNSVYARNAYEAIQAQQVMMQQPQYAQVPQPQYAPYAAATPMQQYQAPVYSQPLPGVMYDPNAEPAGSRIFLKILRLAGGITSGIYTLFFLYYLMDSSKTGSAVGTFIPLSYSVFVFIFSLCRKKIGKGAFIALIIPMAVMLYLSSSVFGTK
ncbi:MAG: zinc-ribbon domain-containing protein [Clostridiales bacterium]|nr:zinc-ribbon domain-containing protein [Clostridiales bacterium]